MIKTFEANPNTSCGLRPRLRRDLDHAERQEKSAVFTLLLAFNAPISCLLAIWRCLGPPFGFLSAGIDVRGVPSSCLRLARGCLDAPKAAWRRQLAAQTLKKLLKPFRNTPERAQASVQSLRTLLESPKQRKTSKTLLFSSL